MSRDEKLHTAVLVAPASERRRLRKAQKEAAARLIAEQRQVEKEASRAKAEAERRTGTCASVGGSRASSARIRCRR